MSGSAPLATTLSAFINGGTAPFAVSWSLPGSNATTNLTGLMVSVTYGTPGWYPATAFVYNTTSSWGTVLVGYGSVWLYVSGSSGSGGNGSGNGSGNRSGNSSGLTPIAGHGPVPASVGMVGAEALVLVAAVAGGLVGATGGFFFGRRRDLAPRSPPDGRSGDTD